MQSKNGNETSGEYQPPIKNKHTRGLHVTESTTSRPVQHQTYLTVVLRPLSRTPGFRVIDLDDSEILRGQNDGALF